MKLLLLVIAITIGAASSCHPTDAACIADRRKKDAESGARATEKRRREKAHEVRSSSVPCGAWRMCVMWLGVNGMGLRPGGGIGAWREHFNIGAYRF